MGGIPLQQYDVQALRHHISYVQQDVFLFSDTVADNISFGSKEPVSIDDVKKAAALAAVNLLEMERRPIYALSGGQKQRIAIAGAIARHCEVLILDEPTALLDPDTQLELVVQVQKLVKNRGMTALWVTHRLEELNYCDGAFLLEGGRVVAQGDPQILKQRLMQSEEKE
jgi:energy-coupling factor transport system ATP-binding protein